MKILISLITALLMTTTTFAELPSTDKPLIIVLLGPPGAGKGTHAVPLSKKVGLPHISTGDLFRLHLSENTPLGKKVKTYMDEGRLVPDELVLDMLFSRISEQDCKKGFILDGFPRSIMQAKALDKRYRNQSNLVVLNFNVPDSILVDRITGRWMCKECKSPFHEKFSPPKKKGVCDHCEGKLYQRQDDTAKVVKKRLSVYHEESAPLIDYYDIQNVLYDINSEKSPRAVFDEVMQTVEATIEPKDSKVVDAENTSAQPVVSS